jgi:hypothetical protein
MHIESINKVKARLSRIIKRAFAGDDADSIHPDHHLERQAQVQPEATPRRGGQLKGQICIAENFDAFDDEMERSFYGDST